MRITFINHRQLSANISKRSRLKLFAFTLALLLLLAACTAALYPLAHRVSAATLRAEFAAILNRGSAQPGMVTAAYQKAWLNAIAAVSPVPMLILLLFLPGLTCAYLAPFRKETPQVSQLLLGFKRPLRTLAAELLAILRVLAESAVYIAIPLLLAVYLNTRSGTAYAPLVRLMEYIPWASVPFIAAVMLQYAAVPALLVLHPEQNAVQILRRSRDIMQGNRFSLALMLLSYVPHILLILLSASLVLNGFALAAHSLLDLARLLVPAGILLGLCFLWLGTYISGAVAGFLMVIDKMPKIETQVSE